MDFLVPGFQLGLVNEDVLVDDFDLFASVHFILFKLS